jgi:hypothetical protein
MGPNFVNTKHDASGFYARLVAGNQRKRGSIDRLPSGAHRVRVYAGTDPLTGKRMDLVEVADTAAQQRRSARGCCRSWTSGATPAPKRRSTNFSTIPGSADRCRPYPEDLRKLHRQPDQAGPREAEGWRGRRRDPRPLLCPAPPVSRKVLPSGAGQDTTLHSLRHYNATELIAAGVDIRTVAGRLGHGGGGTTTLRVYAAWVSEAEQRAATALPCRVLVIMGTSWSTSLPSVHTCAATTIWSAVVTSCAL